ARRLAWWRDLLADVPGARLDAINVLPDGTLILNREGNVTLRYGLVRPPRPEAVFVQTGRGLEVLGPADGAVRWRRGDGPVNPEALDDHERLYLAEMVPAAESALAKSVRAVRLADGAAVPVADIRACFGNRLHETGRGVLLQDLGDNDGPALRLVELKTARVL